MSEFAPAGTEAERPQHDDLATGPASSWPPQPRDDEHGPVTPPRTAIPPGGSVAEMSILFGHLVDEGAEGAAGGTVGRMPAPSPPGRQGLSPAPELSLRRSRPCDLSS